MDYTVYSGSPAAVLKELYSKVDDGIGKLWREKYCIPQDVLDSPIYGGGIRFPNVVVEEPLPVGGGDRTGDSCNHQWAIYTGLSEQFEYCTVCDTKKDE